MNIFKPIADHEILNPIRDFSSYFFYFCQISIIEKDIFKCEHVFFVTIDPKFVNFDFEKEFLKQFKTVYCSINDSFSNYDFKVLQIYASDIPVEILCDDLKYHANQFIDKRIHRLQKNLLKDLQEINEYLRFTHLLKNF